MSLCRSFYDKMSVIDNFTRDEINGTITIKLYCNIRHIPRILESSTIVILSLYIIILSVKTQNKAAPTARKRNDK